MGKQYPGLSYSEGIDSTFRFVFCLRHSSPIAPEGSGTTLYVCFLGQEFSFSILHADLAYGQGPLGTCPITVSQIYISIVSFRSNALTLI